MKLVVSTKVHHRRQVRAREALVEAGHPDLQPRPGAPRGYRSARACAQTMRRSAWLPFPWRLTLAVAIATADLVASVLGVRVGVAGVDRAQGASTMRGVGAATAAAAAPTRDGGAWKWAVRRRVWDRMEAEGVAAFPRPVHHRVPNFVGAELAAAQVERLPEWRRAGWVKVDPDAPQAPVRLAALRAGKTLLVPQPRLRTGFFSILDPKTIDPSKLASAVTQAGVREFGIPIDLDADIKVDLIVIGSVAVNPATGARLGKGEGYSDLEYGMLRHMGAVDDRTPIVTAVDDCQLVGEDEVPAERMSTHDAPVDIVCTPTRTVRTITTLSKPTGVYWERLSPQKLGAIRVLRQLKARLEAELGTSLPTGPDEEGLPPEASRGSGRPPRSTGRGGRGRGRRGGGRR